MKIRHMSVRVDHDKGVNWPHSSALVPLITETMRKKQRSGKK
jgi:hypothetical protein